MNPISGIQESWKTVSGILVMLIVTGVVPCFSAQTQTSHQEAVRESWEREFAILTERLTESRALHRKRPLSFERMRVHNKHSLILPEDRSALDIKLRRTRALLNNMKSKYPLRDWSLFEQKLNNLNQPSRRTGLAKSSATSDKNAFLQAAALQRSIALSNPLLDFSSLLFVVYSSKSNHMNDQYFGNNIIPNIGGLYLLENAFSDNPVRKNILQNSTVQNGRFKGKNLNDDGFFLSPELSYDGETVYFAWGGPGERHGFGQSYVLHIFKCNKDGSNLVQLTDGKWDDFDPCELPNGRIAFISLRNHGRSDPYVSIHSRCGSTPNSSYLLHSMKSDGSDIISLSYHETNQWHPSVDNNGMILFTQWDYVDRDSDVAHHIWTCYPDGRDPRAPHGNYPHPWTMIPEVPSSIYTPPDYNAIYWGDGLSGKVPTYGLKGDGTLKDNDGRYLRPFGEWNIRAIPGSQKYIATAGPHHGQSFGTFVLIDLSIEDDGMMSNVTRLTPDVLFPESEIGIGGWESWKFKYATAWPLSEDYYLCSYNSGEDGERDYDLYLLDAFGNRTLIYDNKDRGRAVDPIPFRPREKPIAIATKTYQGENNTPNHPKATISVTNIYETYPFPWPEGVREQKKIKWMRIIQLIPKTTIEKDKPKVGCSLQGVTRMSLGVVPVEEDGSVFCEAPVGRGILFQALDENFMAIQSMRAITYVHPGEHLSCYGCHESKWKMVPPLTYTPKALTKKPSKILEEFPGHHTNPQKGGIPHNFHLLAKPALKKLGYNVDNYGSLCRAAFYFNAGFNGGIRYSVQGGSRTVPGYYGARYSQIGKKLLSGDRAKITDEEYRRIVMWLDGQSYELGSCTEPDAQRAGQVVWPRTDVDPSNPLGVEDDGHPVDPVDVINDLKEKGHIAGDDTRDLVLNPILVQQFGTSVVISNPNRENLTIKLCNSRGQVLRMLSMNRAQNKIRTKVTDLPTGLYFITLTTDTRNISRSIPVM